MGLSIEQARLVFLASEIDAAIINIGAGSVSTLDHLKSLEEEHRQIVETNDLYAEFDHNPGR